MRHRKIVEEYYSDINNLADLLSKLVNSYRLLIGGVGELNGIALAHKKSVKDALERANDLGHVIDDIIDVLDKSKYIYLDYCKLRSQVIECKIQAQYIQTEIDEELKLDNNEKDHD
ncbi:hypothetical protein [Clostridium thailandense]|uniref:Uncharacterized protein n=1 Tax=Clostridium thailandense TaxID=2794346 RepID=A0A949TRT8_9CLOT|nr:hypothetical protein [Clostridium thailandense]MBV7272156.1 hypothetical protein [Clostridium thailandense]MCH5135992.1 hypothetical protein [Clostridiaceae bacterium UIB06]